MLWTDDEEFAPKAKRAVGRPTENPFNSTEFEQDFARRGEAIIRHCYTEGELNTRQNFVFSPHFAVSKTFFWSCIYIYLKINDQIKENLQGYQNAILLHFDPKVTSDRSSLCQCVGMLRTLTVYLNHSCKMTGSGQKAQEKYRKQYRQVVKAWEMVLTIDAQEEDSQEKSQSTSNE